METKKNPLIWLPTSYTTMALVYMFVTTTSAIMYRNLGLTIKESALLTSSLGLPYTIRPIYAAFFDMAKTKKFFIILSQFIIAALFMGVGLLLGVESFTTATATCMLIIGIAGSIQDLTTDGIYVTGVERTQQAKYQGFQGAFWQAGFIISQGPVIWITGIFHDKMGMSWIEAWRSISFSIAAMVALVAIAHMRILPVERPVENPPKNVREAFGRLIESFATFLKKPGIWIMILFTLLYRTSQGFMDKIAPMFCIEPANTGGLGLTNSDYGFLSGTIGTAACLIGGILIGRVVAKRGLKKYLVWLCMCVNVPNVIYIYLAATQPQNLTWIGFLIALEKFFWGMGGYGNMVYMMTQVAPHEKYKMTHYAFATALMSLCWMLTGMISGYVYEFFEKNFVSFFTFAVIAAIPSFLVTIFAPFHHPDANIREGEENLAS
jgi:MFS transporter, PAT family, beta-lactamase induction signal transducer AmpG